MKTVRPNVTRWLDTGCGTGYLVDLALPLFPVTVDEHLQLLKKVGFQTVEIFWLSQMQAGFYAIK